MKGYGNTTSVSEELDFADRLIWRAPVEDFDALLSLWNEVKTAGN